MDLYKDILKELKIDQYPHQQILVAPTCIIKTHIEQPIYISKLQMSAKRSNYHSDNKKTTS